METPHHTIGLPSILVDSNMEELLSKVRQHSDENIFFDDYVIKKRMFGGMGEVIICEDREGRQMALKSFQKQFYFDYKIRLLFYNASKNRLSKSSLKYWVLMSAIEKGPRFSVGLPSQCIL